MGFGGHVNPLVLVRDPLLLPGTLSRLFISRGILDQLSNTLLPSMVAVFEQQGSSVLESKMYLT